MNSRKSLKWCRQHQDCHNPERLCQDLESDFHAFKQLKKKYPSKYRVVRYEDFALDLKKNSRRVLEFYGLPIHNNLETYLDSHTSKDPKHKDPAKTNRDSKKTPFLWRSQMTIREILKVQASCRNALSLWGYNLYSAENNISEFNPMNNKPSF